MKIQKRMEANQFKAPVERVRYAIVGEENGLAGLFDDPPVRDVCSLAGRIVSGEGKHRSRSQTPRPLTTNDSRLNLLRGKMGVSLVGFNGMPVSVIRCSLLKPNRYGDCLFFSPPFPVPLHLSAARQQWSSAGICLIRIRWPRFMPAVRLRTRLRKSSARRPASASSTTTSHGIT